MVVKAKKGVSQKQITKLASNDSTAAVIHILATNNDIIITATDQSGAETLASCSGGMCVKACRDEASLYAAQLAMSKVCARLHQIGIQECHINLRSRGGYYETSVAPCTNAALRCLAKQMRLKNLTFQSTTPKAHGLGCRVKGSRRGVRK